MFEQEFNYIARAPWSRIVSIDFVLMWFFLVPQSSEKNFALLLMLRRKTCDVLNRSLAYMSNLSNRNKFYHFLCLSRNEINFYHFLSMFYSGSTYEYCHVKGHVDEFLAFSPLPYHPLTFFHVLISFRYENYFAIAVRDVSLSPIEQFDVCKQDLWLYITSSKQDSFFDEKKAKTFTNLLYWMASALGTRKSNAKKVL